MDHTAEYAKWLPTHKLACMKSITQTRGYSLEMKFQNVCLPMIFLGIALDNRSVCECDGHISWAPMQNTTQSTECRFVDFY